MRTLKQIQKALSKHRPEVVAADTGLSFNTVRYYMLGKVTNPRHSSLRLLNDWLDRQESGAPEQVA